MEFKNKFNPVTQKHKYFYAMMSNKKIIRSTMVTRHFLRVADEKI